VTYLTFGFVQTINHRRLVQEVYDKKVLHNLAGAAPKPTVVQGVSEVEADGDPPWSARSRAKRAIRAALEETDDWSASHFRATATTFDDDEEGRYHISRRSPPHKRRKTGKRADRHTVFTTDDDAEDMFSEIEEGQYLDSEEEGQRRYHGRRRESRERSSRRRSYWLTKGNGIPDTDEDKDW